MATEHLLNNIHAIFKFGNSFKLFSEVEKAVLYYKNSKHDLIKDETMSSTLDDLENEFKAISLEDCNAKTRVILNYYELGELIELSDVYGDYPLALFLEFSKESDFAPKRSDLRIDLQLLSEESEDSYSQKFDQVKESLEYGHCYQINLTTPSDYSFKVETAQLYDKFLSYENLSEFAHCIHIPVLEKTILSNSPECLFIKNANKIETRPIKGTVSKDEGVEALKTSLKDESELNIITDLLRNDLSRIGKNFSKVVSKKSFLEVPGLIHQFSEIEVELEKGKTLYDIIWALFPGGSITGAPKKRVLKLIKEIEKYNRGLYTGSTILIRNGQFQSSINIRTADICNKSKKLRYGAGGGITLLSEKASEYREMQIKKSSFLNIFS